MGGGSVEHRASDLLRPWTMRRLPAALNPNVSAGIRADEHAASPSRMRGIQWRSSACAGHAAKRRCIALRATRSLTVAGAAQVGSTAVQAGSLFPV